jgi:hypothetical protein
MTEIRPLLRFAAASFTYERAETCYLQLQVADDGLILAVFDPLPAAFVLLEHFPIQKGYAGLQLHQAVARILQEHRSVRSKWKKVQVISMSPLYTLIPPVLAAGVTPDVHLNLVHRSEPGNVYTSVHLRLPDVELVYAWPSLLADTLENYYPGASKEHYMSRLLKALMTDADEPVHVTAHVHGFYLDVIVIRDQKLIFSNIFSFQHPEDFIYFLLLVFDRLGLDREKVSLHLCGAIESGSALYNLCFKYFRTVDFLTRKPDYPVPMHDAGTDPIPRHAYFCLLQSSLENH